METAENQRTEIVRLCDDLAQGHKERDDLEQEWSRLQATVEEIRNSKELEVLLAINEERQRWDRREERLLQQIAALEERDRDKTRGRGRSVAVPRDGSPPREMPITSERVISEPAEVTVPWDGMIVTEAAEGEPELLTLSGGSLPVSLEIPSCERPLVFAYQLPPLAPYSKARWVQKGKA
jgi:hypothetical protein